MLNWRTVFKDLARDNAFTIVFILLIAVMLIFAIRAQGEEAPSINLDEIESWEPLAHLHQMPGLCSFIFYHPKVGILFIYADPRARRIKGYMFVWEEEVCFYIASEKGYKAFDMSDEEENKHKIIFEGLEKAYLEKKQAGRIAI